MLSEFQQMMAKFAYINMTKNEQKNNTKTMRNWT